ncbi:hypothetical protein [Halanaerobium praevalens]|uniref:DUF945 domain-containing protein n=1 Tax=Halanaerobium praevalens (strain ATCC 33744 / DSM 2228 / GSL) TaxID=572479 RepID=E3DM77_HALPG|nr:hypothetical protein [Halanaerobium praevalens]ADO77355.1 hypothetical protein Hprae_1217 [Halanaerobium praevalens DSM 2228]
MKKFFKKSSIYILLLIIAAGIIFSLNNYYGAKISADIKTELNQLAENNNYQLELAKLSANPLLQRIEIRNLDLKKKYNYNLNISEAKIYLSWQQVFNYLFEQDFKLAKNFESEIKNLAYSSLVNNYQLNFKGAQLAYQGDLSQAKVEKLDQTEDLYFLLEDAHNLSLKADEVKYDYPFYRYLGFNKKNWDKISSFDHFVLKANYDEQKQLIQLEEFNLSGDILKIIFNLNSELAYNKKEPKIEIENLAGKYDLLIAGQDLGFEPTSIFKELKFNQFAFNGNLDLDLTNSSFKLNQFDFSSSLKEFEILLAEDMNKFLTQNTFGLLSVLDDLNFKIDEYSYQQEFTAPNGNFKSKIDSSLFEAQSKGEYNYDQKDFYINNALLKYKVKTKEMEQLNYLIQIMLAKNLSQDEEGYYRLEYWGDVDDLNFK